MKKIGIERIAQIVAVMLVTFITASASAAENSENVITDEDNAPVLTGETAEEPGTQGTLPEDFLSYGTEEVPKQSLGGVMLRLILSMIAIVGLIYGTVYVLKYFAKKGTDKPAEDRLVQVVDKVNLDAKRSVYLVKVIDRLVILGVGGDNVRLLGEINDESVVESVKSTDFSFHLGNIFSRLHAR